MIRIVIPPRLTVKQRRKAEEDARQTGVCPCCGGRAAEFTKRRGRAGGWTWSCAEGCNP